MTGRTHAISAISGLAVALVVIPEVPVFTLGTVVACLLANQIGSITPDIDQPTAPFWRNLPIGGFFGRMITKLLGGHRFLTHSLIGVALAGWLASLFLAFISPLFPTMAMGYVWWAFMIGILSHLIIDSLTKEGVPWLLPIPIKLGFPPVRKLRLTTGETMENYIIFPGLVLFNLALVALYYDEIVLFLHTHIQ